MLERVMTDWPSTTRMRPSTWVIDRQLVEGMKALHRLLSSLNPE